MNTTNLSDVLICLTANLASKQYFKKLLKSSVKSIKTRMLRVDFLCSVQRDKHRSEIFAISIY